MKFEKHQSIALVLAVGLMVAAVWLSLTENKAVAVSGDPAMRANAAIGLSNN